MERGKRKGDALQSDSIMMGLSLITQSSHIHHIADGHFYTDGKQLCMIVPPFVPPNVVSADSYLVRVFSLEGLTEHVPPKFESKRNFDPTKG